MPAITCASSVHLPGSPIASPTTPTASDPTLATLSSGMAALSVSTIKTLIVDDNEITAKLLSKILSKEFGHDITCSTNGKEALLKLSRETFDIVFMDIDMPELSGIETTLLIHSKGSDVLEQNQNIPIIAYTTNPCEDRFFEAGMTGWVGKPANQFMVRQELERIYREARPPTSSSSSSSRQC